MIAGILTPEGATTELLDVWRQGEFDLVVCPQLVGEVRKALVHPRIGGKYGIEGKKADAFAARLGHEGILLDDPVDPPREVPDDPKDDYLVALTLSAGAAALVTRDKHFQKVRVRGLRVISARQALGMIRRY